MGEIVFLVETPILIKEKRGFKGKRGVIGIESGNEIFTRSF